MLNKSFVVLALSLALGRSAFSQELQAHLTINAGRVGSKVDKKIFQTLQTALNNLLNNRKWTNLTFQQDEKIPCNFLLNISDGDDNVYKASLTVQAARPVYNTSYQTPLINFIDQSVAFRYVEFQTVEFNENNVSGTDPLASNLTATLAYYVYVILGLDFDSFSQRGGDPYFQKALTIVNNAPESREISGWRAFDGLRNRYWLIENLTNSRYASIHEALYDYFRKGLDHLYGKEEDARKAALDALSTLNTFNTDNTNTMIIPFFFQGRTSEMVNIFKKAPPEEKQRALEMLTKMDISNINTYKQSL